MSEIPSGPWGNIPADVFRFVVSHNGRKSPRENDQGVEEFEVPIEELSIELLRQAWGPGSYQIQWMGESEGKRVARGNARPFNLLPLPGDEEPEDEPQLTPQQQYAAVPSASAPIAEALMLLTTLTQLKNAEVEMTLNAQQKHQDASVRMFELMINRESNATRAKEADGAMVGAINAMSEAVARLAAQTDAMNKRLAALEEEPDDDSPGFNGGDFTVQPGQGAKEVATAIALNGLKENIGPIVQGLSSMAAGFGAKMVSDVQEKKDKANGTPPVVVTQQQSQPPPIVTPPPVVVEVQQQSPVQDIPLSPSETVVQ